MDLLCTENIVNEDCLFAQQQVRAQQQQTQHKRNSQPQPPQQQHTKVAPSVPSPYSNSSLSSSASSSSSSSGYNSLSCVSSNSNSSSSYTPYFQTITTNYSDATNNTTTTSCPVSENATFEAPNVYGQQQQQPQQQQQQTQQLTSNVYTQSLLYRSLDHVNTATEDPTFLTDRCLEIALKAEEKRPQPVCTYFKTVQKDITPAMRKIVAEWMMEVCAEEKCQEEVVLLALNYMDRFLSTKSVRKTHLQILAAACLLLASKLREPSCRALSAELLVFYTDNSICKGDLIKWELFVLSRLGWDLSSVTPLDFLELLLIRLPIKSTKCSDLNVEKVRQHAQAFISLAAKEHHFSMYSASTIAASSIAAALSGLNWHLRTGQNLRYLLNLLTDLTSIEQEYLHNCMMKMEQIFEEHSRNLQPYLGSGDSQQQAQQPHQSPAHQYSNHSHIGPDLTQTCKMQANAQKDVQDIKF